MLKHKGHTSHAEYDAKAGIFHGKGLDLRDVIPFEGTSAGKVKQGSRDSIDDHLEFCEQT